MTNEKEVPEEELPPVIGEPDPKMDAIINLRSTHRGKHPTEEETECFKSTFEVKGSPQFLTELLLKLFNNAPEIHRVFLKAAVMHSLGNKSDLNTHNPE